MPAWCLPAGQFFPGGMKCVTAEPYSDHWLILDLIGPLNWIDFSPDSRRVLTAGLTPYVRVWNAGTGEPLTELTLGKQPLRVAQWSLDGRFIVARSDDQMFRVWDSSTGEAVTPVLRHAGDVRYAILGQQNRLITLKSEGHHSSQPGR